MRARIALLCIIFIITGFIHKIIAQNNCLVTGVITDSVTEQPIEYISVMAEDSQKSQILFTSTGSDGKYTLNLKQNTSYSLTFNMLGYKKHELEFTINNKTKITQNATLSRQNLNLDEVVIKETLPPISYKEDTTIYRAEKFYSKSTRKLGALLQTMPGITVDRDYNVYFYGQQISKVLVEGKPFFNGDSELAVKSLPANAVENIVVLENYHILSFLKDYNDDGELVIDVELKEDKKQLLFGDAAAGYGYEDKYEAKSNLYYYSDKVNLYSVSGILNTEESLLSFNQLFSLADIDYSTENSYKSTLAEQPILPYNLSQNNENIENNSALASLGVQTNFGKKFDLDGYAIYHKTLQKDLRISNREYSLSNNQTLTETRETSTNQNLDKFYSKLKMQYAINNTSYIINNSYYNFDNSENDDYNLSKSLNTSQNTLQEDESSSHKFYNITEWYHNLTKKTLGVFNLFYHYENVNSPNNYEGSRAFLTTVLKFPFDSSYIFRQNFDMMKNYVEGSYSATHNINTNNQLILNAGYAQELATITQAGFYSAKNNENLIQEKEILGDNTSDFSEFYASMYYRYKKNSFNLKAGLNLNTVKYGIQNVYFNRKNSIFPVVNMEYSITNSGEFDFSYSGENDIPRIHQILTFPSVLSFDRIRSGNQPLTLPTRHNFNLDYNYQSLIHQFSLRSMNSYSLTTNPLAQNVSYNGISRISEVYNETRNAQFFSSRLQLEKDFYRHYLLLSFSYRKSERTQIISNEKVTNTRNLLSPEIQYRFNIRDTLETEISLSHTTNFFNRGGRNIISRNYRLNTTIEYFILEDLRINISYALDYFKGLDNNTRHYLNSELIYQPQFGKFGVSLKAFNILNYRFNLINYSDALIYSETRDFSMPRYFMLSLSYDI